MKFTFTLTFTCKHTDEISVDGPSQTSALHDAQEIAFSVPCKACKTAKAKAAAEKANLPELEGSEKQVAWALTLRKKLLKQAESSLKGLTKSCPELGEFHERMLNTLKGKASAKFWIENRNDLGGLLQIVSDELTAADNAEKAYREQDLAKGLSPERVEQLVDEGELCEGCKKRAPRHTDTIYPTLCAICAALADEGERAALARAENGLPPIWHAEMDAPMMVATMMSSDPAPTSAGYTYQSHYYYCKCGKPIEQTISGELICQRCYDEAEMSEEDIAHANEIEYLLTHCNDTSCDRKLITAQEKRSSYCRYHQIQETF